MYRILSSAFRDLPWNPNHSPLVSMKGIIIFKNMKWSELTGVMKKSYFVIGNDSGPSHIASCLDINGLVLFGDSTSATRSGLKKSKFKQKIYTATAQCTSLSRMLLH